MRKNAFLCKSLIYALLLLWLTLSGSYAAWQVKTLFTINGYLAGLGLIAGGWFLGRNGSKPLTWPLITFWLFGLFVSVLSRDTDSVARIYFWAILIAIYHIPHDLAALRRGARWAGWPIFISVGAGIMWENGNSMAMLIWGLFWLGVGEGDKWRYLSILYAGLAGWALLMTYSQGGVLAVLAGSAMWAWLRWPRHRALLGACMLIGLAVAWVVVLNMKLNDVGSFWNRLELYKFAWAGFQNSPLIGNGINTFFVYVRTRDWGAHNPHNLILTVLWETGLVGLAISIWLVARLLTQHRIQPWAAAWLVTLFSHSMVDLPLYASFFTAVTLFIILGGLPCKEKITSAWPWPRRWVWPWPAQTFRSRPR